MRKKKQSKFPAKYVLLIMTILCAVIIGCSLKTSGSGPVSAAAGAVLAPMQKGVNQLGSGLTNLREHLRTKKSLEKENEELRTQLADAQQNLNQVQLNQEELDNLKSLYDMDQNYADYDKIAANVIGKDAGNWFSVFLIDRGSNDGITVGMNVLADGGLAGIVIQVGPNYAKVRSIIDDNSNVSARNLSTSDLCVVSGSLKTMNESSLIDFDDLRDFFIKFFVLVCAVTVIIFNGYRISKFIISKKLAILIVDITACSLRYSRFLYLQFIIIQILLPINNLQIKQTPHKN